MHAHSLVMPVCTHCSITYVMYCGVCVMHVCIYVCMCCVCVCACVCACVRAVCTWKYVQMYAYTHGCKNAYITVRRQMINQRYAHKRRYLLKVFDSFTLLVDQFGMF